MKKLSLVLAVAVLVLFSFDSFAQKAPKDAKVKMCNSCHKTEGKNKYDEYKQWLYDTHSKVLEVFKTDKAKEIAKKNNPAKPESFDGCYECHVVKVPKDLKFKPTDLKCDTCHDTKSKVHPIKDKVEHPKAKS